MNKDKKQREEIPTTIRAHPNDLAWGTQQVAPVGVLDTVLCFISKQLHCPLCLVLLPWKKKSHWAKLCPLPLPSLFRGYFLSCHSSQETILMLQANIQMYIFFWIAHSDSCSDPGSWPCSESPLSHCCFGYLLMFNLLIFCHSPTLCYYLPFNLVMAGYVFGKGFPASFLKQLGCLQALEQI